MNFSFNFAKVSHSYHDILSRIAKRKFFQIQHDAFPWSFISGSPNHLILETVSETVLDLKSKIIVCQILNYVCN